MADDKIEFENGVIYFKSCEDMRELADGSVSLTVTSPPYYLAKATEVFSSYDEFLKFIKRVLLECKRVTRQGRLICWNVSDFSFSGEKFPIPADCITIGREIGLKYCDDICWCKPDGMASLAASNRAGNFIQSGFPLHWKPDNRWEHILLWRNGDINYDDYKSAYEENILGSGTMNRHRTFRPYLSDVWYIPPVTNTKDRHPLEYPEDLVRPLVILGSLKGETVLDPFLGSGTTMKVALELGRKGVGYEINPDRQMVVKSSLSHKETTFPCYRDLITRKLHRKDSKITDYF